eukprot:UN01140
MNSIVIFSTLVVVALSQCDLIEDKYCCGSVDYANECFATSAGENISLCQHNECPIIGEAEEIIFNSSEWNNVKEYLSTLDSIINAKLLDSGIRLNYGCWDYQRLTEAKVQIVNGKNYYTKLQLLCDPLGKYAHIYFYLPINMDVQGHIEFPHPELKAIQYPKLVTDALNTFASDNIHVISPTTTQTVIGGDRDEYGCISSAGYSWCADKNKCLRPWEEDCSSIGDARDNFGCVTSAGYQWCEIKNKCYRWFEEDCVSTIETNVDTTGDNDDVSSMTGDDRDEHGCVISGGYQWCDIKNKCYRWFEEDCVSTTETINNVDAAGDNDDVSSIK